MNLSLWRISAVSFIIISSINLITVLPLMIGALQDNLGFSELELGLIASSDTMGVVISGWLVFKYSNRFSIRSLVVTGLAGLGLAHLGSIVIENSGMFISIRLLGGFCGGIAYTTSLAYFARLSKPQLGYVNYVITFSLYSALLLIVYPGILAFDYRLGFLILAGLVFISILISWNHFEKGDCLASGTPSKYKFNWQIILILIAFFGFQGGNASIFSFMERLGNESGISAGSIGLSIGVSIFVGVFAGITVLWMSKSIHSRIQIILGLAMMIISEFFLYMSAGHFIYYLIGVCLLGFGFSISLPNLFNLLAEFDREGKNLALGTMANWFGQAVGPFVAGWYLLHHNFIEIVWPSGFFLILSMLCIVTVSLFDKTILST